MALRKRPMAPTGKAQRGKGKMARGGSFKVTARQIAAKQGKTYPCRCCGKGSRPWPNSECYRCRNG